MKKSVYLMLIVLFVFILGACATATPQPVIETQSQPIEGMINPGDKISDFLITIGDGDAECVNDLRHEISEFSHFFLQPKFG